MKYTRNFEEHNKYVSDVWKSYQQGKPIKTPVILGINPRLTMNMPEVNVHGTTFEQYCSDAKIMVIRQIENELWLRFNLLYDHEMGLPKSGWDVRVDFQNVFETAWFGANVNFHPSQVPDVDTLLTDDRKNMLFNKGLPSPKDQPWAKKNEQLYVSMLRMQYEGFEYAGRPIINVTPNGTGTDGPMTLCCNLRGASAFAMDMLEDPEYAHQLLSFVTEATIARILAYRKQFELPSDPNMGGFADDSIELLSTEMYSEMVLPYHKRLKEALWSADAKMGIHLCGNVQRHLPTIKKELNLVTIDTGFPIDHALARKQLGPDVEIMGGPSVPMLINATPEQIDAECKRILESGVKEGGKFVLRKGNNLAPNTPIANINAMYEASLKYGRY